MLRQVVPLIILSTGSAYLFCTIELEISIFLYYFLNLGNIADFLRLNFNESQLFNSYSYIFWV